MSKIIKKVLFLWRLLKFFFIEPITVDAIYYYNV